jgi:hypothetical protein
MAGRSSLPGRARARSGGCYRSCRRVGFRPINPATEPKPVAICCPTACSTDTAALAEKNVSDGSNGEHVMVSGTVTRTLLDRVGEPTVIVIPALAIAAVEPAITAAVAVTRMARTIIRLPRLDWLNMKSPPLFDASSPTVRLAAASNTSLTRNASRHKSAGPGAYRTSSASAVPGPSERLRWLSPTVEMAETDDLEPRGFRRRPLPVAPAVSPGRPRLTNRIPGKHGGKSSPVTRPSTTRKLKSIIAR